MRGHAGSAGGRVGAARTCGGHFAAHGSAQLPAPAVGGGSGGAGGGARPPPAAAIPPVSAAAAGSQGGGDARCCAEGAGAVDPAISLTDLT